MTPTPTPDVVQAAAALDPTMLALLSIFGGVALTVVAGFFGAWIQARREHKKWLREQRYESFVIFLGLMEKLVSISQDMADITSRINAGTEHNTKSVKALSDSATQLGEQLEDTRQRIMAADVPMRLLGPASVESALTQGLPKLFDPDPSVADIAKVTIIAAMRKPLGVKV